MPPRQPTNLTTRGRVRRGVSGLLGLAFGAGVIGWLRGRDVPWPAAVGALPLFVLGMLGVLQALAGT